MDFGRLELVLGGHSSVLLGFGLRRHSYAQGSLDWTRQGWVLGSHGWVLGSQGWVLGSHGWVLGTHGWVLGSHGWALGSNGWALGSGYLLLGSLLSGPTDKHVFVWF